MAIQIRRGTDSQWESNKSNIVAGEPAITTDTGRFMVGTGTGTFAEFAKETRVATLETTVGALGNVANLTYTVVSTL